jgi:hypothetical protein
MLKMFFSVCESVSTSCALGPFYSLRPLALERAVLPRGRQFPDNPVYRAEKDPRLYFSFLTRKVRVVNLAIAVHVADGRTPASCK